MYKVLSSVPGTESTRNMKAVIKVVRIKEMVGRIDTCGDQHCFRSEGGSKRGENIVTEHPLSWAISKTELIISPQAC